MDNAEGLQIPHFISETFRSLPICLGEITIHNYVGDFLVSADSAPTQPGPQAPGFNTFASLWHSALAREQPPPVSVLEPACGSANDYRFLEAYGLARLIAPPMSWPMPNATSAEPAAQMLPATARRSPCCRASM